MTTTIRSDLDIAVMLDARRTTGLAPINHAEPGTRIRVVAPGSSIHGRVGEIGRTAGMLYVVHLDPPKNLTRGRWVVLTGAEFEAE